MKPVCSHMKKAIRRIRLREKRREYTVEAKKRRRKEEKGEERREENIFGRKKNPETLR